MVRWLVAIWEVLKHEWVATRDLDSLGRETKGDPENPEALRRTIPFNRHGALSELERNLPSEFPSHSVCWLCEPPALELNLTLRLHKLSAASSKLRLHGFRLLGFGL